MSKVPVLPASGFRDFLPSEAAARLSLEETIKRIYQSHGFQPIGMPMLENLSTLQGKGGGSDNEKLIFKVLKRGEELQRALDKGDHSQLGDMGLRFDLTLPLARYCARFKEQLPKPFKVFQIGPVWRADRPQKGRYREFFQCDVDIVGAKEIGAEVECIEAILEVFRACGMDGIELHLNDRRLLSALRDESIPEERWSEALIILDKLDKIGPDGVSRELAEKFGQVPPGITRILSGERVDTLADLHPESFASLNQIVTLLEQAAPDFRIVFNPTLVRGQDYYTGTIFELRHPELSGSLGGGGRYNRLLEVFGSPETPAFGGSIGFERLFLLLQEKNLLAGDVFAPQLFFPLMDTSLRGPIHGLAGSLRRKGLRVDIYPDAAKLKKQFEYADQRRIPYVAVLGSDEWKAKTIKVKDMALRTERSYSIEPISEFLEQMEQLCKR
jgi:histidyl-tRNA synthetase